MSNQIKTVFEDKLPIHITPSIAMQILRYIQAYEARPNNAAAFMSPYLGVEKGVFTTEDRNGFFDIFSVDVPEIQKLLATNSDGKDRVFGVSMKHDITKLFKLFQTGLIRGLSTMGVSPADIRNIVSEISSVDANYKVASDPFNLFCTYLVYQIHNSKLPDKQRYELESKVFLFLQYKFFTSLVTHRFPYRANEDTMQAMYESLNAKFDIKKYGTWRKVMEVRCSEFLAKDGIHYKTISEYNDDKKIIYLISDIQTRIRNQINIVTTEYMRFKKDVDTLGTYSHAGTDLEGEKALMAVDNNLDLIIETMFQECMIVSKWLDEQAILLTSKLFQAVTVNKFRMLLIAFSEYAVKDAKAGTLNKVKDNNGKILYVGAQVLLRNILQKSYRHCIQNRISPRNKLEMLRSLKDVYGSSRISDEGIIAVRDSTSYMVENLFADKLKSPTMLPTYRLGFIIYCVILSFKHSR